MHVSTPREPALNPATPEGDEDVADIIGDVDNEEEP
jgi:hypothetical protein